MDVSHITDAQAEAWMVASERWEPHFEPVRTVLDPSCENHVWNDMSDPGFERKHRPAGAVTAINLTVAFGRDNTQVMLNPNTADLYSQEQLEDTLTHELAHVFGVHGHWGDGLMSKNGGGSLGTGLTPSTEDRAKVAEIY